MIDIRHITFAYQRSPVLRDVSFHIQKGDFVSLVGSNGSGKSTLIKCLAGILKTQEGQLCIDGQPLGAYSSNALARIVSYVPQKEKGRTSSTVFDAVLTGRKPYMGWKPLPADFEKVADVLGLLHIEHLSMKKVNELSGGQQQIVTIARALAQEPQILLLDEPTANLDLKHQLEILELLKKLSTNGITVVVAIHDINMAIRYTSHVVMLKEGEVFACGNKDVITVENIESLYGVQVEILHKEKIPYIIPNGLYP
jgi:iron complex transport system ATP-binding protein